MQTKINPVRAKLIMQGKLKATVNDDPQQVKQINRMLGMMAASRVNAVLSRRAEFKTA